MLWDPPAGYTQSGMRLSFWAARDGLRSKYFRCLVTQQCLSDGGPYPAMCQRSTSLTEAPIQPCVSAFLACTRWPVGPNQPHMQLTNPYICTSRAGPAAP
jgi:hypothetical protein